MFDSHKEGIFLGDHTPNGSIWLEKDAAEEKDALFSLNHGPPEDESSDDVAVVDVLCCRSDS